MNSLVINSVAQIRACGVRLGEILRAGDVLTLAGPLGAGKTTFTQALATGLGISGVSSPTFVIARAHHGIAGHPGLVHVDAYRLLDQPIAAFDDLELERYLGRDCIVVEWGSGLAERISSEWLEIEIQFVAASEERILSFRPHGDRWNEINWDEFIADIGAQ